MLESQVIGITNPEVLAAVSNPTRLRILALLRNRGPKTVGMISASTGVAPGSISYHLGKLAEVQLVKRVDKPEGDKRESWWETPSAVIKPELDPCSPSSSNTRTALLQSTTRAYSDAMQRYIDSYESVPKEWKESEIGYDAILELTPNEMQQLESELMCVLQRWTTSHSDNSSVEKDDRRQVVLTLQGYLWNP